MNGPTNMFWDSCVFIRWLTQDPDAHLHDIDSYIKDARKGHRKIYFSTIALAEVRPRYLKSAGHPSMAEFLNAFQGAFIPVESTPDVMMAAGELRDAQPVNPMDKQPSKRVISTPDAIQLAACLYLRDAYGVSDVVFHTFDDGKGKGWEGKCVSLLNFHQWFPSPAEGSVVHQVCQLPRSLPLYPQLGLFPPPKPAAGNALPMRTH